MRRPERVVGMGRLRSVYRILVETFEGKTSLGKSKHSWENIHINLEKYKWCDNVDWINLAQDRDDCSAGNTGCVQSDT